MKAVVGILLCVVLGVFLVALGCGLISVFHNLVHNNIKEKVKIQNGTDTYSKWLNPPYPIYFQIWVYDVINPAEIIQGAKPFVQEKGPYTYREHRHKVNVTFYKNGTVGYQEIRMFEFDRERSAGSDDDVITTVSIPMVSIVNMIRFEYSLIKELLNFLFGLVGEPLFIKLKVRKLLWGYEDRMLKDAKVLLKRYVHKDIPDKFGLFMTANDSDSGRYIIYTGVDDTSKFGIIDSWNGNRSLHFWTTDTCNKINGTDGAIFPPFIDKSDELYVFSNDICRSIYTTYTEEYEIKGVNVYRFGAPSAVFENKTVNPANEGFCTPRQNCLDSGVLNVSVCQPMNAPVILSQPHFRRAAPKYRNAVGGIHSSPDDETIIDIEPLTGVLFKAAKKMQINVFLENVAHIREMKNLPDIVFPILWMNESSLIDDDDAATFRSSVEKPIKITEAVQYGLIAIGAFILVCTIIFTVRKIGNRKKEVLQMDTPSEKSPLINSSSYSLKNASD